MAKLEPHKAGFVLLLIVSLLIGWRPLIEDIALSLHNDEFTYILLIFPVSAALIIFEWKFLQPEIVFNFRAGLALLTGGILFTTCVYLGSSSISADARLSIQIVGLLLWWIGSFVLCFGFHAARSVLFSLLFLFGLVPLPKAVLDAIILELQLGSTWVAHGLFAAFGLPVIQHGVLLSLPGLTIQVAQECSSIRSSSMLLVVTMVLAHVLLRSFWRKTLLISLAIPLSVAKNGLRIFMIAILAIRVNRGYLTGKLHHQGGILFFAMALLCIVAAVAILRKGEESPLPSKLGSVKASAVGTDELVSCK